MNILLFDSGMGGLSVYQEVRRRLPQHRYDFVFDNAFFPYGEQPASRVIERCTKLISALVSVRQIDLVIIACNTASTVALPALRQSLDIPVVGVVPAIKPAARMTANHHIALLATPATVHREYTDHLIAEYAADCQVLKLGTTDLVIEAERKMAGYPVNMDKLSLAIAPITEASTIPDVVILGCTHFPLLKDELQALLPKAALIDSGAAIARRVETLLNNVQNDNAIRTMDERKQHERLPGCAYCAIEDNDTARKESVLKQMGFSELKPLE